MLNLRHLSWFFLCGLVAAPSAALAQSVVEPQEPAPQRLDLATVQKGDLTAAGTIDEEHPERSVPTPEQALRRPLEMGYLMMDLIARAEAASQRGDHAGAVKYYQAIAKAVPERAVAWSKICRAYKELGEIDLALDACKQALGRGGVTAEDHAMYVRLRLARAQRPSDAEIEELDAVVTHLEQELGVELPAKTTIAQLRCEIGLRLEDAARLRGCVEVFRALLPHDPRTYTYAWALAVEEHDFARAEQIVEDAKQAGLPRSATQEMETRLESERAKAPFWFRLSADWSLVLGAATALLLALTFTWMGRRGALRTTT